jgi:hypothetical protein
MRRLFAIWLLLLPCLALAWPVLAASGNGMTYEEGIEPRHRENVIPLSPIPPVTPDTQPSTPYPGSSSSLSVDNPANARKFVRFEPYNTHPRELDLWNLEGRRFVRSPSVLSPDKSRFAYSEILYMPNMRQTIARMYLVSTPQPTQPQEHLPSEDALYPQPKPDPARNFDSYNPDKTLKLRHTLVSVGYDKVKPFEFKTLTIVDWSASGQRLLFKQRSGVLHVGLRTSDILVYDEGRGTVAIYPEIHRAVVHYWQSRGNLPQLEQINWDIQPLGWESGSDSLVLLKAWAYDKHEKKFLGIWRYDFDAERTELLTLDDTIPPVVAANGWLPSALPVPPKPDPKPTVRQKMFGTSKNKTAGKNTP